MPLPHQLRQKLMIQVDQHCDVAWTFFIAFEFQNNMLFSPILFVIITQPRHRLIMTHFISRFKQNIEVEEIFFVDKIRI